MIRTQSQAAESVLIKSYKPELITHAELALSKIASKPNGQTLLKTIKQLSTSERFVSLEVTDKKTTSSVARPQLTASQLKRFNINDYDLYPNTAKAMEISRMRGNSKGEGVSSTVVWNVEDAADIEPGGLPVAVKNKELAFVTLAHELVHASRYLDGSHYHDSKQPLPGTGAFLEEERAVGIGRFQNERISENGIRAEHKLKIRQSYYPLHR